MKQVRIILMGLLSMGLLTFIFASQSRSARKPLIRKIKKIRTVFLSLFHSIDSNYQGFLNAAVFPTENSSAFNVGHNELFAEEWDCDGISPDIKNYQSDLLTPEEKLNLLNIARQSIKEYVQTGKVPFIDNKYLSTGLLQSAGAFVTLRVNRKLRGCIGSFAEDTPLYKVVQEIAISSATQDLRFKRIRSGELDELEIQISVLTPMQKIQSINEFIPGRDGIYIRKGESGGTLLPQVANETGWSREELLGHCSREKVGIGWNGWKNADLYTYQAVVFASNSAV